MTSTQTSTSNESSYTVPGLAVEDGHTVARALQDRLHALNDLQLTLKHAHWNVVGRDFIAVHEMLDPQIELVRGAVDVLAERMAAMGVPPVGTPGALVASRSWDDYGLVRATCEQHLAALDIVYDGVIGDHRKVLEQVGEIDPVTEDILVGQTRELEQFQWFLRAHLETADGSLDTEGATTEMGAAEQAVEASQTSSGTR